MDFFNKLKRKWFLENINQLVKVSDNEINSFESVNNISLPNDLKIFFKSLNGTNEEYDNELFCFYSFKRFNNIGDELINFKGVPDYRNIVRRLNNYKNYYSFADYSFHMFTYVIKLDSVLSDENEVLVICGDRYKKIANSFSEFIQLYLDDSIELYFND